MPHQLYEIDGVIYPSVTQILSVVAKPKLIAWANRLGLNGRNSYDESHEIGGIGSLVHERIEQFLRDGMPIWRNAETLDKRAASALTAFEIWYSFRLPKPIKVEESFISQELGYAGTIDLLAEINGTLSLLDFKTSKDFQADYFAQLCAYKRLLNGKGIFPERLLIVRLDKNSAAGEERAVEAKDEALYMDYFDKAFELYKVLKKLDELGW